MTPRQARRAFTVAAAVVSLWQGHPAEAGIVLREVDTSGYPTVKATVVSSAGPRAVPVLTEDGAAQPGLVTDNLGRAKSVVLAVDRSQSMTGRPLEAATAAARAFVARKPQADAISVVALGSKATRLSDFSTATIDADTALGSLTVDGAAGTALYDAVVVASQALGAQPLRGRVLILLTDGRDVSSRVTLDTAIAAARNAGVIVYPIGIEGRDFVSDPLLQLARATGGRYYPAPSPRALAAIYASVASELAHTWVLSYPTAARPGDTVQLRATVAGARSPVREVVLPVTGPTGGPSAGAPLFGRVPYGHTGQWLISFAAGILVLLAVLATLAALRRPRLRRQISVHIGEQLGPRRPGRASKGGVRVAPAALLRATERVLGRRPQWARLELRLVQADVPLRAAEFIYVVLGAALVLGVLAAVVGASAPVALLLAALGASGPFVAISFRTRRRLATFEAQLPDMLVTMAASLKAGHSFRQGIQAAVDEDAPPASDEFRRVITEAGLGRPIEAALNDMAGRVGSKNFEFVITAVTIQRQVGGSLSGLFDLVADTVRQRQQAARKIRSLTAMGRMSAYVLLGLPLLVAGVITLLNPGYMSPLYHTSSGHMLLAVGVVMMCIGAVILRSIVSFKG